MLVDVSVLCMHWGDGLVVVFGFLVFFLKQKTAYEMRISDWSSDVCSSDLTTARSSAGMTTRAPSVSSVTRPVRPLMATIRPVVQIGRASCRERVCQYV